MSPIFLTVLLILLSLGLPYLIFNLVIFTNQIKYSDLLELLQNSNMGFYMSLRRIVVMSFYDKFDKTVFMNKTFYKSFLIIPHFDILINGDKKKVNKFLNPKSFKLLVKLETAMLNESLHTNSDIKEGFFDIRNFIKQYNRDNAINKIVD